MLWIAFLVPAGVLDTSPVLFHFTHGEHVKGGIRRPEDRIAHRADHPRQHPVHVPVAHQQRVREEEIGVVRRVASSSTADVRDLPRAVFCIVGAEDADGTSRGEQPRTHLVNLITRHLAQQFVRDGHASRLRIGENTRRYTVRRGVVELELVHALDPGFDQSLRRGLPYGRYPAKIPHRPRLVNLTHDRAHRRPGDHGRAVALITAALSRRRRRGKRGVTGGEAEASVESRRCRPHLPAPHVRQHASTLRARPQRLELVARAGDDHLSELRARRLGEVRHDAARVRDPCIVFRTQLGRERPQHGRDDGVVQLLLVQCSSPRAELGLSSHAAALQLESRHRSHQRDEVFVQRRVFVEVALKDPLEFGRRRAHAAAVLEMVRRGVRGRGIDQ